MSNYSEEHKEFLKKKKKEKIIVISFQILILLVFILGWELLARFNLINTFLLSSPSLVLKTLGSLFTDNDLLVHIGITLYETVVSFLVVTIISLLVSTLFWFSKRLAKILDPYLTVLNSLPKVALGPLIIIWVGASTNSIIFMALLISLFLSIINVYHNFKETDSNYITLLRSLGASKLQIFMKAVIPSNLSNIINNLKINVSMCYIGVIMGELLVSKKGLGYLIMYGTILFVYLRNLYKRKLLTEKVSSFYKYSSNLSVLYSSILYLSLSKASVIVLIFSSSFSCSSSNSC